MGEVGKEETSEATIRDFHSVEEEKNKKKSDKKEEEEEATCSSGSMSGRKNIFGNVHLLFLSIILSVVVVVVVGRTRSKLFERDKTAFSSSVTHTHIEQC
jgi:hypothetical protein